MVELSRSKTTGVKQEVTFPKVVELMVGCDKLVLVDRKLLTVLKSIVARWNNKLPTVFHMFPSLNAKGMHLSDCIVIVEVHL
jgi:hypothetical protein